MKQKSKLKFNCKIFGKNHIFSFVFFYSSPILFQYILLLFYCLCIINSEKNLLLDLIKIKFSIVSRKIHN